MYSAFIIHFATDVLAQGQQQKPKKCIHLVLVSAGEARSVYGQKQSSSVVFKPSILKNPYSQTPFVILFLGGSGGVPLNHDSDIPVIFPTMPSNRLPDARNPQTTINS